MTVWLIVAALVVGTAFGGWLRGEVDDVRRAYPRRYNWQASAWDVYVAVRSGLVVAGCGLVGHHWKQSILAGDIVECGRCGKVDWHPKRGPNVERPLYLHQMRVKGDGISIWDGPRRPIREPDYDPNLLTDFGDGGYTVTRG